MTGEGVSLEVTRRLEDGSTGRLVQPIPSDADCGTLRVIVGLLAGVVPGPACWRVIPARQARGGTGSG